MGYRRGFYMITKPDDRTQPISFKGGNGGVWYNPTFDSRNSAYKFAFNSYLGDNDFQVVEIAIGLA